MLLLLAALAGDVAFEAVDKGSGATIACRLRVKDSKGKPVQPPGLPFWRGWFAIPGKAVIALEPGTYEYDAGRGPEYTTASGSFTVGGPAVRIGLERIANLAASGWWSGDLHIHRDPAQVDLLTASEDLHVAPVITWWNDRNLWEREAPPKELLRRLEGDRLVHLMAGEDERGGGALLYFNLSKPLAIKGAAREHPSPLRFLAEAAGAHVDIEKPFWWDAPVWLSTGKAHTVGLANNHLCLESMLDSEAWGKPRDKARHPGVLGNGQWTQEIYHRILDAGLRVPPSAGSASGVLPNPVGYNRVYVHLEGGLDWAKWWEGLAAGRSFVTNGPLLVARVNDKLPGHVFEGPVELDLKVELTSRDTVGTVELIRDGVVERAVPPGKPLGKVAFKESGWFLIRAVTTRTDTYRFASTAPWYVEVGPSKSRISRAACRFFLDWVKERGERLKLDDPAKREEVLKTYEAASRFWQDRLEKATVD